MVGIGVSCLVFLGFVTGHITMEKSFTKRYKEFLITNSFAKYECNESTGETKFIVNTNINISSELQPFLDSKF